MLYKYLDARGGRMMLYYSNIMFTNATRLNDPFDCHPALIDFSDVPAERCKTWPAEVVSLIESDPYKRYREKAYICSLSKEPDSLLMWSYYNQHKGVCIGLDMEKTRKYLSRMTGLFVGCQEWEVQYKDIVEKPNYFRNLQDFFQYQMTTKAKAWEHEQEVRLFSYDPLPIYMRLLPGQYEENKSICDKIKRFFKKRTATTMDWYEVHPFLDIGVECFESVYLGERINEKDKEKIIKVAKERNPEIKIYQMKIDPEAFKLKEEII